MIDNWKCGDKNRDGRVLHMTKDDLNGNAPDKSEIALPRIDFTNDMEFERGALLFRNALPAARNFARSKNASPEATCRSFM